MERVSRSESILIVKSINAKAWNGAQLVKQNGSALIV